MNGSQYNLISLDSTVLFLYTHPPTTLEKSANSESGQKIKTGGTEDSRDDGELYSSLDESLFLAYVHVLHV